MSSPSADPSGARPSKHPARTIRVDDELWQAARAKADERGESLSSEIRDFLRRYIKRS